MELETENTTNSIKIPLSASDEYIQLFVDELEDDPTSLISLLFDEYVPPKYWIQIAVYFVWKVSLYRLGITVLRSMISFCKSSIQS